MNEAIYFKHYIRIDAHNRIVEGFTDARRSPVSGDIFIHAVNQNTRDSHNFQLQPNTSPNPPLRNDDETPLYEWNESLATETEPWRGIVERTAEEIEADRIAIEQSPANQIAALNTQINQGLPDVVVFLYDALAVLEVENPALAGFHNKRSEPERSKWREMVAKLGRLKAEEGSL